MSLQERQYLGSAGLAEQVRGFYDRYPYPRPVESLDRYRRRWQDRQRRHADFRLFWPAGSYRGDRSILIAGCGTSQAAKHALRWPEAQVTGIDFSATSVRCTEDLKRKYNLDNLQIHQLPIERIRELETKFDQIVCTGVLHHLPDPDAGLDALHCVLKPSGAMYLMVYAPYGRAGIYMLQEYCRGIGIHPSEREIRDLAATLRVLPQGHPLAQLLDKAPDFRTEAGLADALLHPQDRAYTVPQLCDLVERAGLTFGRWLRQAPYLPQCGALADTPHSARLASLPIREQYAAVELFRGTMVRHSAILYHKGQASSEQVIRFDGDNWQDYVPIRLPRTICVKERLPSGAAAVLINQNHTYPDLILPIGRAEERIFEAIDGQRSIAQILEHSTSGDLQRDGTRAFFERLWWYDQVVFDTSLTRAGPSARSENGDVGHTLAPS
jgi:SAM-dependent methyltransferase